MPEKLNSRSGLSKTQKMGFILLFVFAIFAVGLGILQIRNNMYAPFALNNEIPPLDSTQINSVDALKYRDTDHDGLSDYDELYVYGTSPYLADTDSDGVPDGVEIQNGTNPLCDEKKNNCNGELGISSTAIPTNGVSSSTDLGVEAPTGTPVDLNAALSDPTQLRQMLLSAGVDKTILDNTSDADLLNMAKDILSSTTMQATLENSIQNSLPASSPQTQE